MNKLVPFILGFAFLVSYSTLSASSIFEDFRVTTESAEIYEYSDHSITLESKSPTYLVKLEPNVEGSVIFSLSSYGYASSVRVKNIVFGVHIEGYVGGELVTPVLSLDDANQDLKVEGNFVKFQRINGAVPVFFNTVVDSVKLKFSNCYGLDVHQFLSIDDLKIVRPRRIPPNPMLVDCEQHSIMIGLDGSASIDKSERKTIAKQLLAFFKKPPESLDSNSICIMEFGRGVHSMSESIEKKEIVKDLKVYKKGKEAPKNKSGYTNWAIAFDQAIDRKPDIFIFITDRWSNYSDNGPASFGSQYETLISKCNKLKSNGTRLLFITSGLNTTGASNPMLHSLLSQQHTNEVIGVDLTTDIDLKDVDLITMDGFETFERIDLTSLLDCGQPGGISAVEPN
jgi:hypothetical protein